MTGDRSYRPTVPDELRALAAEQGLELLGVAAAAPQLGSAAEARRGEAVSEYRQWIARGYHGEMVYLELHSAGKFNPERMLPGCRSLIVVGLNYFQRDRRGGSASQKGDESRAPVSRAGSPSTQNAEASRQWHSRVQDSRVQDSRAGAPHNREARRPVGRIARYAWGRDYHKTLGGKLKRLRRALEERYPGYRFRPFTDATPLAERLFAEEAGIGFIGRNTLAINARLGSWFVIGELLTTLELPPSEPPEGVHGACPQGCRRCIEVCPTGALEGPHRINASRCISYLTIELKGSIPEELRPLIGDWLFGCDLCQEVCPLNAPAQGTDEPDFTSWRAGPDRELEEVLAIETEEEFTRRFAGTPLMRAKRRGLLRNAAVVAANRDARSLLPLLRKRSGDEDPVIAEHAAWALRRLGSE